MQCKAKLTEANTLAPSISKISTFKNLLNKAENEVVLLINAKNKSNSLDKLNLNYQFPRSQNEFLGDWISFLEVSTSSLQTQASFVNKEDLNNKTQMAQIFSVVAISDFENDTFADLNDFCNNAIPPYLSDMNLGIEANFLEMNRNVLQPRKAEKFTFQKILQIY